MGTERAMTKVEQVLSDAVEELGRMANVKACAGEPIAAGDYVIIPIATVAFGGGFGLRGGAAELDMHYSDGGGVGFGGSVRPVAAIIVGPDGVRVEPIPELDRGDWSGIVSALAERLGDRRRK
jgi:uncharacterized spore protein YtfJ